MQPQVTTPFNFPSSPSIDFTLYTDIYQTTTIWSNHHSLFTHCPPYAPSVTTVYAVKIINLPWYLPRPHVANTVQSARMPLLVHTMVPSFDLSYVTSPASCISYGFESTALIHCPSSALWHLDSNFVGTSYNCTTTAIDTDTLSVSSHAHTISWLSNYPSFLISQTLRNQGYVLTCLWRFAHVHFLRLGSASV